LPGSGYAGSFTPRTQQSSKSRNKTALPTGSEPAKASKRDCACTDESNGWRATKTAPSSEGSRLRTLRAFNQLRHRFANGSGYLDSDAHLLIVFTGHAIIALDSPRVLRCESGFERTGTGALQWFNNEAGLTAAAHFPVQLLPHCARTRDDCRRAPRPFVGESILYHHAPCLPKKWSIAITFRG